MFDTRQFLDDHFQCAAGVQNALGAFGLDAPSMETTRKWFQRGSVPSDWLPVLLAVLELEQGEPVRIARYVNAAGGKG